MCQTVALVTVPRGIFQVLDGLSGDGAQVLLVLAGFAPSVVTVADSQPSKQGLERADTAYQQAKGTAFSTGQ